jgi:hypothetical protein
MHRPRYRIAVCGSLHGAEADAVADALRQLPDDAEIHWSNGPPEQWLQSAGAVDLCIVLQGWPDEIPVRTAHALIAACSAGRLICCQGAWCASTGRTRATWPPAVCVPIEQFASRLAFELNVLAGHRAPVPATASRDEAFAAHYAVSPDVDVVPVRIDSPDSAYARELQQALNPSDAGGHRHVTIHDLDVMCDVPQGESAPAAIAVAGFPRSGQTREGESSELQTIVPKLAPLAELQSAIQRAVAGHP